MYLTFLNLSFRTNSFRFSEEFVIDTDVEPWRREGSRIAMLGDPRSGKSWNNSLVAEQFLAQGGNVVIFQPRDEHFTLKKFDVVVLAVSTLRMWSLLWQARAFMQKLLWKMGFQRFVTRLRLK